MQNCYFILACPPFSDPAFRHEATFCFSFLPRFFLSKTSQKFYLHCLQSAQYRNSKIITLHSSEHTYIVHVVPLPTYYSHIFSKLIWTAKLLQFLLLSLVRNIHAPQSHSNLVPSPIYLHAENGLNFKAKSTLPKTRKYCQGLLWGTAGTFFQTSQEPSKKNEYSRIIKAGRRSGMYASCRSLF
jgi:hypothetical protein